MSDKDRLLDDCMIHLVNNQSPFPLGIKAALINEYLHRDEFPVSPAALVSMDTEETNISLLEHYADLVGYQFSWGFLTESFAAADLSEDADEYEQEDHLLYEFILEGILKRLPRSDLLDFVMVGLYREHSLFNEDFDTDVGSNCQSLLSLRAFGTEEVTELRLFVSLVFIPHILPDLLAYLERLVEIHDVNAKAFDDICQLAAQLETQTPGFRKGSSILHDAIAMASLPV